MWFTRYVFNSFQATPILGRSRAQKKKNKNKSSCIMLFIFNLVLNYFKFTMNATHGTAIENWLCFEINSNLCYAIIIVYGHFNRNCLLQHVPAKKTTTRPLFSFFSFFISNEAILSLVSPFNPACSKQPWRISPF